MKIKYFNLFSTKRHLNLKSKHRCLPITLGRPSVPCSPLDRCLILGGKWSNNVQADNWQQILTSKRARVIGEGLKILDFQEDRKENTNLPIIVRF